LDHGFLRRGGEEVPLRPKAFAVLRYLVQQHGRLVTKAELIDAVWSDTAITDNSLAQCLVEIRRALEDDAQQVIRTVSRRGYIFAAPVTTPAVEFSPRQAVSAAVHNRILGPLQSLPRRSWSRRVVGGVAILILAIAVALVLRVLAERHPGNLTYIPITNFADSAVSPALSPDGRMVTFIRGEETFTPRGEIYVKILPDGEPVQLTHDGRPKMSPVFFPTAHESRTP
jgi:DNA-binding winged helix-turn-helix (wHTH) protein